MIRTLDLRGDSAPLADALPRARVGVGQAESRVAAIVADVEARGELAVLDWGARLDGMPPASLRVPESVIESAELALDPGVRSALEEAISRTRRVHAAQLPDGTKTTVAAGGTVEQRWIPVERIGVYVPGGRAVYPSSVIMNVVPAQIAGVDSIAMASPPQAEHDGWPHPTILAAASILGVTEVYAAGGAQAIAMLARGTEGQPSQCQPVSVIVGPGNRYVAIAKRLLRDRVGVDAEAGPTEIAILADDTAQPRFVAADLISQAEHDDLAACVLVTPSEDLARRVWAELDSQVATTKHGERVRAALAGQQSAVVLVASIDQGVRVVNEYAAEHVEIQTREAQVVGGRITNAGAIFVGSHSPVPLGDYLAGSNHVLPTAASARYSSGLSVATFLRGVQVIEYDSDALAAVRGMADDLAIAEDLPAHAAAIDIRFGSQ